MTTSAYRFQDYERHLKASRGLANTTIRNYIADLNPFWEYLNGQRLSLANNTSSLRQFIGRYGIQHIDHEYRSLVRDYISWLLESRELHSGVRSGGKGHERTSVTRCLAALRSFFRYLIKHGKMQDSPIWAPRSTLMRKFTPKPHKRLPRIVTVNEATLLVEAPAQAIDGARNPQKVTAIALRDRALLELLYSAGLRVSEITAITIRDLSLEENWIKVTGKGSKGRQIPIGRHAIQALHEYLTFSRPILATETSYDTIFLGRRGGKLSIRTIQFLVNRYAKLAGLSDNIHPHMLRHSYATHLLDGGADLRIVQELLGHSTPSATQVYTHISQVETKRAYLAAFPLAQEKSKDKKEFTKL